MNQNITLSRKQNMLYTKDKTYKAKNCELSNTCRGCSFHESSDSGSCKFPVTSPADSRYCTSYSREDQRSIIWVEVPGAKGWPIPATKKQSEARKTNWASNRLRGTLQILVQEFGPESKLIKEVVEHLNKKILQDKPQLGELFNMMEIKSIKVKNYYWYLGQYGEICSSVRDPLEA